MRLRSLRGRITAGLVLLVLVITAVTGLSTALLLRSSLLDALDRQLASSSERSSAALEDGDALSASDDVLQALARGQSVGTLAVLFTDGAVVQSAVVRADGTAGAAELSSRDVAALGALRPGEGTGTADLGRSGDYRVLAVHTSQGTQVTGLPLEPVTEVITQLVSVEAVVGALAALLGSLATALVVRRALSPLEDVAAAALHVSQLPLAGTSEGLPGPISRSGRAVEVERVADAVDRMVVHVRAALESRDREEDRRRRFVADASHELRTPLAVVQAHVESALLADEDDPGAARHALVRIRAAATRMASLVEDLLLLAHLDAGRGLAHDPVPLSRLVLEAVADARATDGDRRWLADLPEEPVDVTGDSDRLHQVVAGLLGNATRHTPAGTTVTTELRLTGRGSRRCAEVVVRDDGPGVPAELRETVLTGSPGPTRPARRRRRRRRRRSSIPAGAARVWAWPSPAASWRRTAGSCSSSPGRAAPSGCGCRRRAERGASAPVALGGG